MTTRGRSPGSTWPAATVKRVAAEPIYGPIRAADAIRLVARLELAGLFADQRTGFQAVWLYLASDKSPRRDRRPRRGRRAGLRPRRQVPVFPRLDRRRARSRTGSTSRSRDMLPTLSPYLVTLAKATPNPLLKETDEEGGRGTGQEHGGSGKGATKSPRCGSRVTSPRRKGKTGGQKEPAEKPAAKPLVDRPGGHRRSGRRHCRSPGAHPGAGGRCRGTDRLHPPRGRPPAA